MSHFIYAIESTGKIPVDLEPIVKRPLTKRGHTKGPGGGPCKLITTGPAKDCVYIPDQQSWEQSMSGDFWIGFFNDRRPTPADLKRDRQLAGHPVCLADGENWLVPVVRIIQGGSAMPKRLRLGKDGEVIEKDMPEYASLSEQAETLWRNFRIMAGWDDGTVEMGPGDGIRIVVDCLKWNYHVGIDEINVLELLTTENLVDCYLAIIDWPTFINMVKDQKKKDQTGIDSTGGLPD